MESVAGLHIICLLGVWLSCGTKVLKLLQKLPRSCFDVWWEGLRWEGREDPYQKEEVQRQLWGTAGWWMTSPSHDRFMKMSEKYILLNSRKALLKSEEEKIQFSWVKKRSLNVRCEGRRGDGWPTIDTSKIGFSFKGLISTISICSSSCLLSCHY